MRTATLLFSTAIAIAYGAPTTSFEDLKPIEAEVAKGFGKLMADEAAKFDKPQIKIEADADKANGAHIPDTIGVLIVPQKDLKESEELAAKFKADRGAPLAFLFLYRVAPVVNNATVDKSKLRPVKLADEQGKEHTVHTLLLSVRQVADDDYRLYAYGYNDKPIVDAKFSERTASGTNPVVVEVKDVDHDKRQGKLVVSVFGKYQATFTIGHMPD